MARRTKEDAAATRSRLLDAAEVVFSEKGVAGASLADVAAAASLSRGAIYWHFKGKAELFDAMMQRVTLPFEQAWERGFAVQGASPVLNEILQALGLVLRAISRDASTRCVFDIALHKIECVGEMRAIRELRILGEARFIRQMEAALVLAAQQSNVILPISVEIAVRGLHAIFKGVLQTWLLHDDEPFDLEAEGMQVITVYLAGLGLNEKRNS